MTAWIVNTNANLFFDKKTNRKLANTQPSLHFYGMIILMKTKPLCIGMMAAIPKICLRYLRPLSAVQINSGFN